MLAYNQTGGTFIANDSTITCTNEYVITGGSIEAGTSTIVFDGNTPVNINNRSLYNVTLNANKTMSLASDATVNGLLSFGTSSNLSISGRTLKYGWSALDMTNLNTFNTTNSTLEFIGTVSQLFNSGGTSKPLYNILHSGSGTVQLGTNNVKILNDFTNTNGVFTTEALGMTIDGNWTVSGGSFESGGGFVTFENATKPSVFRGNSTFYNIYCSVEGKALTFEAGSRITILRGLTFIGSPANLLTMRSSVDNTSWEIEPVSTSLTDRQIKYVDVKDSRNITSNTLFARFSTDRGNNINWLFGKVTWVALSSGNWSNPNNWAPSGVPSASEELLFNYRSAYNSIVDAPFQGTIYSLQIDPAYTGIIRMDRNLTSTSYISVDGGSLNTHGNVLTTEAFEISAGSFTAESSSIRIAKDFVVSGGTVTADTSSIYVGGSFEISGNAFNPGSSTLYLNGAIPQAINMGSSSLNNLTLLGSSTVTLSSDVTVIGDLNHNSGVFSAGSRTVTIGGNMNTSASTFNAGTSTFIFNGTTIATNGANSLNNVQIGGASSGGSLILGGNADINGNLTVLNNGTTILNISGRTLKYSGSNIDLTNLDTLTSTGSTLEFDGTGSQTFVSSGVSRVFGDIIHTGSGTVEQTTNDVKLSRDFVNSNGVYRTNNNGILIGRSFDNTTGSFEVGTSIVTFEGTGTVTSGGTSFGKRFYNLDHTAGTLTFGGDISTEANFNNIGGTISTGNYNLRTIGDLSNAGVMTAGTNNRITSEGNFTNTGTFNRGTSTVYVNGPWLNSGASSFHNLSHTAGTTALYGDVTV